MTSAKMLAAVLGLSLSVLSSGVLQVSQASAAPAARHHPVKHRVRHVTPGVRVDTADGVFTQSDDRVYGGAFYGYFTSPTYGRYQAY